MGKPANKKRLKRPLPHTAPLAGEASSDEYRFRKRKMKKQADRDEFGDDLAVDMAAAAAAEDWPEYNRIKAILFRTT